MSDDTRMVLIQLLGYIAAAAVVIWLISAGVRSGMKMHRRDVEGETRCGNVPELGPPQISAQVLDYSESPEVKDGPGRFLIRGVDRDSKMDTTWHVNAESAANARVKAELEGIIVTSVEREGG